MNIEKTRKLSSILLIITIVSLVPSIGSATTSSSKTISSQGLILNNKSGHIDVDKTTAVTINNLSVGFALDHHWNVWLHTPEYSKLAKEGNFKIISVYDNSLDSQLSFQPCSYWNETTKTGVFNWTDVDAVVSSFYQIGSQPLICLGGTAGSTTVYFPNGMYVDPITSLPSPEDYANYAVAWVEHFKSVGLPVKYYEIFNEIQQLYFPNNTKYNEAELSAFFDVYKMVYEAMHNVNDQILVSSSASTYKNFLNYWVEHGGHLDFLSFHKYVCDKNKPDSTGLATLETKFFTTDNVYYGISDARQVLNKNVPVICSEYGWDAAWATGTDPRNQQMVSAVALALTLRQEVLLGIQYNLYYAWDSSAMWQAKQGTGLGFGMVNQDNNQPWYPYYVNKFLGQSLGVGDRIISSTSTSQDLRTLSWIHNGKIFTLVICTINTPHTIKFGTFASDAVFTLIDDTFSYTTPKVQTGVLGANNQLIVKGYAVVLLES